MTEPMMKTVALVGTGVIGRGWIQVFSRAGCHTRIYDTDASQIEKALAWLEENLEQDVADGVVSRQEAKTRRSLVSAHCDLKEALSEAEYIQESGTEKLDIKQAIFAEIDKAANPESGVADVDAVDTVMRDGLGLRWALLGTFGVNNTNADGGVREYYRRFGEAYKSIMRTLDSTIPSFTPDFIERIAKQVDAMEGHAPISEICRWRDRIIRKIRTLKEEDPHP